LLPQLRVLRVMLLGEPDISRADLRALQSLSQLRELQLECAFADDDVREGDVAALLSSLPYLCTLRHDLDLPPTGTS
jgi:hypothetical protein